MLEGLHKLSFWERLDTVLSPVEEGVARVSDVIKYFDRAIINNRLALESTHKQEVVMVKKELDKKIDALDEIKHSKKVVESALKKAQKEITNLEKTIAKLHKDNEKKSRGTNKKSLTCKDIKAARLKHSKGVHLKTLAKEYDVSTTALSKAIRGVTYKDCGDNSL